MKVPQVSVIIPVFERAELLAQAVQSVFAQTLHDFELIIADDGSADDTRAVCRRLAGADPRARVLELAHTGNPAIARNAALRAACGEFVAFLDSDDLWMPAKLERQLAQLRADPRRRWSYTGFEHMNASGRVVDDGVAARWAPCEGDIFAATVSGRAPIRSASVVMAARDLLNKAGGFDEQLVSGQDYDLWMRLALRHPVVVLRERLATIRVHARSHSNRWPPRALEFREISLRKIAALAGPPWQPLIARQRRRNAAALAASYLEQGARREMFASMRRNLAMCWRDARWWASSARTLLRALATSARRAPESHAR